MSAIITFIFYSLLYGVAAAAALVVSYAAFLYGAFVFFQWQEKRAVLRHARLRAEGF